MPPPSGRERIAAAATAAVVVLLVVIVVIQGRDSGGSSGDPASGEVGSPDCGSGDLVAAGSTTEAAAGTTYLTATLQLAPDVEPCRVKNYPDVVVLDAGSPVDVVALNDPEGDLGDPQELVVLPNRPVLVTLGWAATHYCDEIDNDGILLEIAPGLELETAGFGPTSCGPGEDDRPPVRVGPYTYVDPRSTNGVVTGVVALNGGPGPGTGEFVTRGQIEFAGASNEAKEYRTTVDLNGKYEIDLPAGRYQVRVSTLQYRAGEPFSKGTFVVVRGELNELNVILPVR